VAACLGVSDTRMRVIGGSVISLLQSKIACGDYWAANGITTGSCAKQRACLMNPMLIGKHCFEVSCPV